MKELNSAKLVRDRVTISCIINRGGDKKVLLRPIFDTGAMYTLLRANRLGRNLNKSDLNILDKRVITGFAKDRPFEIYKIKVLQLTVSNISLENKYIWVTFDDLVSDDVIGFDILKDLNFFYNNLDSTIHIFKTFKDMQDYMIDDVDIKNLAAGIRD